MADKATITPAILRKLISYDPLTGAMIWRERDVSFFSSKRSCDSWNTKYAGKAALCALVREGYRSGHVLRLPVLAHRVAWALHFGEWPNQFIDHINGIRADNRIANLRDVPRCGNQRNLKMPKNNTSGITGVRWDKVRQRWLAQAGRGGAVRFLTFCEALLARKRMLLERGFHENHGKPR